MGIVQAPSVNPGQVGVIGAIKYMTTTDSLSTVTTAGYLNNIDLAVNPVLPSDILGITYNYSTVTNSGSFGLFSVSISNGVITLAEEATSGVNLPTIANHIATYTNTTGTLAEDPATAISGGNIQAGLSGTAGSLISYPATGSKGSLAITAVANTGNTVTTISNDAMGQASTVSIPDPANAAAKFLVGATATPFVSGNFPQNSGTAGLMVDSGVAVSSISNLITQVGNVTTVTVTLTASQVTGAYATPVQLIAAPGAGNVIIVQEAIVYTNSTGHTAFATGGNAIIQYGNTVHGAGTNALSTTIASANITAASSQVLGGLIPTTSALTGVSNTGIFFSNATGAFTNGTGSTIVISLTYQTIVATV